MNTILVQVSNSEWHLLASLEVPTLGHGDRRNDPSLYLIHTKWRAEILARLGPAPTSPLHALVLECTGADSGKLTQVGMMYDS